MGKEYLQQLVVQLMMGNFKMILCMVKENKPGLMAEVMKVDGT